MKPMRSLIPSINVTESEKALVVTAELPGLDEENVELSLSHDTLTIKGEKKQENEEKGHEFYRLERSYGAFSRRIPLPGGVVDMDRVTAKFEKGILHINLPKLETAQALSRRIPVKSG
jgi:HSP20 family protein